MPSATHCSVCEHPDRDKIDAALRGGTSLRGIEKAFNVGRTAITGHAAKHTTAAETRKHRTAARGGRRAGKACTPGTLAEPVLIESPKDVLTELRWAYGETKQLYELAKATSDTRLMDKAIGQGGALLEKFAKSFGMYQDGTAATVDRSTKILNVFGRLTDDDLRALLLRADAGEAIALPETVVDA